MGMTARAQKKLGLVLPVYVGDIQMVGKSQNLRDMQTKCLEPEIDLEGPTSRVNQVYLGCTQREAQADMQAVQSKAE